MWACRKGLLLQAEHWSGQFNRQSAALLWAKLSQPEMTRVCKGRRSKADNDPMDESADKSADDIRDVQVATRRLLWHCTNLHVLVKLRYGIDGDGLACMPSMRQHG